MGRVINPDGVGKERKRLTRAVVLAIRELMKQGEPNTEAQDLAAFIALALKAIGETIDRTVTPWEKRGYWLKADKFRLEWDWAYGLGEEMQAAVIKQDWRSVADIAVKVGEKLSGVNVPQRNRLGAPWVGAWEKLVQENAHSRD